MVGLVAYSNEEGHQKVQVVVQFPKPGTIVELRRFLGLVNFYRRSSPQAV